MAFVIDINIGVLQHKMILSKTPVTLGKVQEIVKPLEEKQELKDYLKKFVKLKKDKAEALVKEITGLNNLKIKEEHIVKIADFVPKSAEELNKIFTDVSLTEEETNAILEITEKY
jgi:DNA-directed RNA polymerase subunit F